MSERPHLTRREMQILILMRLGHKGSAMADLLGITQSTIEKYTEMLYLKLNVHCAGQAVAAGYDLGLLTSGMTVQDALKLPNKK